MIEPLSIGFFFYRYRRFFDPDYITFMNKTQRHYDIIQNLTYNI